MMKGHGKETWGGESGGTEAERFIDKSEVGRRTGMRPRTIDDWMKRGILPYYKLGRSVRFKWSEIEVHLAERCRVLREECRRGGVQGGSYRVYNASNVTGPWAIVATTTNLSATISNLTARTQFFYVTASNFFWRARPAESCRSPRRKCRFRDC